VVISKKNEENMINVEKCRIFYEVAKVKNISKAADILFVSQPAVSKAIKELEEHTGCKFFIRTSKGVKLTTEGEIFYKYVEQAFSHLKNGEVILKKLISIDDGIVRIGISNTLCRYYLMPIINSFHNRYNKIQIRVINRSSSDSLELLKDGIVDFVITSCIPNNEIFKVHRLIKIQDIFVTKNKTRDLTGSVNLEILKNHSLMMLERKNETREYIELFLKNNNIELVPEIEIGSMDFLVEFAKIGLGVSHVIKEFVSDELKNKHFYEIAVRPKIPSRIINLITLQDVVLSHASEAFLDLLRKN
jgi:DNA-binding transcriptional LysR family regulator